MEDISFEPTNTIFERREALLEEWTPERLVGRDQEVRQFHGQLQPIIEGESPSNIFLYGMSGVGKTAATRYLLGQLEEDAENVDGVDLTVIEINCDGLNSSYQAAVNIVNTLRDPSDRIATTGYPQQAVYQFMFEELDRVGGTLVIVLDEVDHLDDDSILYKLCRAGDQQDISARLCIIGVSNDLNFRDRLSSKTRSSLYDKDVAFSAYSALELVKVLKQREQVAFKAGVVSDGVIEACAEFGAENSGDARKALDLLLEAGDIARERKEEAVTTEHVDEAKDRLQRDQVTEGITTYTEQGQLVLATILQLEESDRTPARTRTVMNEYEGLVEQRGLEPISARSVRDYLEQLHQLGLVESREINKGKDGGKFKKHRLADSKKAVRAALEEVFGDVPTLDAS